MPPQDLWKQGQQDGYKLGWEHGRFMGKCRAVADRFHEEERQLWPIKVLYVKADGSPYSSLDAGIEGALRGLASQVLAAGPREDVAAVAEREKPDLVLVLDAAGASFPAEKAEALRSKGFKTAVWFPDDPYHIDRTKQLAPYYDYVFTFEISCVPVYLQAGCPRVYYLPVGVNPKVMYPEQISTSYRREICLIGTAFQNRVSYVDQMAHYLKEKKLLINGYWWDRLRHYELLADKITGYWHSPEETRRLYTGAKIVINLHRTPDDPDHNQNSAGIPARSLNPRLFEINACGALQLVDAREELPRFYAPGTELDTFSTPEELIAKIEYYLQHEEERQHVALNGLARTLRDNTFRRRLIELLAITNPTVS